MERDLLSSFRVPLSQHLYSSSQSSSPTALPKRKRRRCDDAASALVISTIRDSLEADTRDEVSFGGCAEPLPGFDDKLSCKLCRVRTCNDLLQMKAAREGATLAEFLRVAHSQFEQEEGRPHLDVAKEINEALAKYVHECDIVPLRNLSDEEVYRHFKFDHRRNRKTPTKGKMLRILLSMLDTSVQTCCEKSESGKVVISKNDATLTLNIIDRIHKIATLKELD